MTYCIRCALAEPGIRNHVVAVDDDDEEEAEAAVAEGEAYTPPLISLDTTSPISNEL